MSFITEEKKMLAKRLVPAIRNREDGKITTGRRGQYHSELLAKNHPKHSFSGHLEPEALDIMRKHDRGFYDPRHSRFLTRDEASDEAGVLDSQDLVPHKHVGGSSKVAMFREAVRKKVKKVIKEQQEKRKKSK